MSRALALLLLVGVVVLVLRGVRARMLGGRMGEAGLDPWAVLGVERGASR